RLFPFRNRARYDNDSPILEPGANEQFPLFFFFRYLKIVGLGLGYFHIPAGDVEFTDEVDGDLMMAGRDPFEEAFRFDRADRMDFRMGLTIQNEFKHALVKLRRLDIGDLRVEGDVPFFVNGPLRMKFGAVSGV